MALFSSLKKKNQFIFYSFKVEINKNKNLFYAVFYMYYRYYLITICIYKSKLRYMRHHTLGFSC